MKYAEFNINSNNIEFFNSLLGNEKVLINGKEGSSRYSLFGTTHQFNVNSENFTLKSSFKALGRRELHLELRKDQELVEKRNLILNPHYKVSWGAIIIILGIIVFNYLNN